MDVLDINKPILIFLISLLKTNEMNFFIVKKRAFIPYKIYSNKCVYIIGTSFFGTKQAIKKYSNKYYEILNYSLENKIYFGIDQNLFDMTKFKYFMNINIYPLYELQCKDQSNFWKFLSFYANYNCSKSIQSFKCISNLTYGRFKKVIKRLLIK